MILVADVDLFKSYVETFGNQAGDRLLIAIGKRIQGAVAESRFASQATVARSGDDEFAVLTPCAEGEGDAAELAEALMTALAAPYPASIQRDEHGPITVCIGAAVSEAAGISLDQMLIDANLALEVARTKGPKQWVVTAPGLRERARARAALTRDFRHAVERGQLFAVYQPQIDLISLRVTGFEALMRWKHPDFGLVSPAEFIPIAESTGMMVPAGEWILREACGQLRTWQDLRSYDPPLSMSVNLSPRQIASPNFVDDLRRVLDETGIPPETLHLEVTETCIIDEKESAGQVLAEIRSTGVGLSLDDFGTGYASLAYLKMAQFDALKIDRSFVCRMDSDQGSYAIVKTILGLAQELHMAVVAEGVESEIQLHQPENPSFPVPATLVMIPAGSILRMRWLRKSDT
jgi:diguanylate cyclase (GGDEF)-like protein